MTAVYRTIQTGAGSASSPYRAQGFDGVSHVTLMIGTGRPAMLLVATRNDVTQGPVVKLLEAENLAALKEKARTTFPTVTERQSFNTWLNSQGLQVTTEDMNWTQTIDFAARQINPVASFERTFLYERPATP